MRHTSTYLSIMQYHQGGVWSAPNLIWTRTPYTQPMSLRTIFTIKKTKESWKWGSDGLAPTKPWSQHHQVCLGLHKETGGFEPVYIHRSSVVSSKIFGTTYLLSSLKKWCCLEGQGWSHQVLIWFRFFFNSSLYLWIFLHFHIFSTSAHSTVYENRCRGFAFWMNEITFSYHVQSGPAGGSRYMLTWCGARAQMEEPSTFFCPWVLRSLHSGCIQGDCVWFSDVSLQSSDSWRHYRSLKLFLFLFYNWLSVWSRWF